MSEFKTDGLFTLSARANKKTRGCHPHLFPGGAGDPTLKGRTYSVRMKPAAAHLCHVAY